jgi:hypothetical protein
MGVELFHADGRIDMTKLIVAFRNFSNAPQNGRSTEDLGQKNFSSNRKQNYEEQLITKLIL